MKNILVVGGAGYIGSHMVWYLGERGLNVITLDDLSSGHEDAVLFGTFIQGSLSDKKLLNDIFEENEIHAVIHFASLIQVGESMTKPSEYYANNIINGLNLLNTMNAHGVKNIIFSSTAAIFGNPVYTPIDEKHPSNPINTYGHTKKMFETILEDYDRAYGIKSVCLRYFNAAGGHPDGLLGERHDPETHLIPLALDTALGKRSELTIFGSDYETEDGTCVRDYVHVLDLAEAHWLALNHLIAGGDSDSFNLGNGAGYSVLSVINAAKLVSGMTINVNYGDRRVGDPAILVADSSRIKRKLGWTPKYADLHDIVAHAWRWRSKNID